MKFVRKSRTPLLIGLGVLLGVAGTLALQHAIPDAQAGKGQSASLDREVFHSSLDLILDRYVEPVDSAALMARGLEHMVAGLDRHSYFLSAAERDLARKRQQQGAEAGLVTQLERAPNGSSKVRVVAVLPGSPAATLGIAPGDEVLSVRGEPCEHMSTNAHVQVGLIGSPGERIDLRVNRGHGAEDLEVELAKPNEAAFVTGKLRHRDGEAIAWIEIHAFRSGTARRVNEAIADARDLAGSDGLAGIVLDLRGNPGGEVQEAVRVADHFVAKGVLTRIRTRGGRIDSEERATSAGTDVDTPLVVLQDDLSASASELLAVALRDHGRATIVGERSFGKGTVQEIIGLADGSVLTLTVARYFSPKDRSIDGRGVEPDVVLRDVAAEGVDAAERAVLAK